MWHMWFKKTLKKQDLTTCGMAISIPVSMARAKTSTPAELHGPPNPGPNGFQLDSLLFLSSPQTVPRTWVCPKNEHPKNQTVQNHHGGTVPPIGGYTIILIGAYIPTNMRFRIR